MFLLAYLSVLGVVALGPQVVLGSFQFTLSPVVQCEPVNITFSGKGANNHSVPTILTILPLQNNATPIQIPIPNGATNTTGIQLTFIPLPADTLFIATLDDIDGQKLTVSDVNRVQNSTGTNIEGCFEANPSPTTFYQVDEELSQCEDFTVTYNTPVAPNITAFVPLVGLGFPVFPSKVSTTSNTNVASYTADILREASVMLLLDDQQGHRQTTQLITVSGDSASPNCFPTSSKNNTPKAKATPVSKLPQSAIIGISVGAAVVGLLAIFLLIYMLLARRRNRHVDHMDFDPALLNQKWPPDLEEKKIEAYQASPLTAPSFSTPVFTPQGFVRDPIYTKEKYAASIVSDGGSSISSWNQFVPKDQRGLRTQSISSSRLSMGTVEIQDILQIATVHRTPSTSTAGPQGRPTPQPSTAGTGMTTFDVAKPAMARLVSTRRSRRTSDTPSVPDVPATVSRNNSTDAATALAGVPTKYRASYVSFDDDDDVDEGEAPPSRPDDEDIGGFPIPSFKTGVLRNRDTSESWGNVRLR
ncbi:hypothetical protein C8R45DRAFT_1208154 [Mycena sanguinolenta]|nr:hypothetical protein C8R45DRAFT_1208154 [Mycena sanguinolenta]